MSTISVRVTLLTLATVMFAVVWANDHKPQPAKARTVVPFDFTNRCPVHVFEPVSHQVFRSAPADIQVAVQEISPVKKLHSTVDENCVTAGNGSPKLIAVPFPKAPPRKPAPLTADKPDSMMVKELAFPIPVGLRAGEYRVVDRFGHVETLTVTEQDLMSWRVRQQTPPRNVYEVHLGEERWHFIRVEQPVAAAPTPNEVAGAWKAVFRFADRTLSPAVQRASEPVSRMFGSKLDMTGELPEIQ